MHLTYLGEPEGAKVLPKLSISRVRVETGASMEPYGEGQHCEHVATSPTLSVVVSDHDPPRYLHQENAHEDWRSPPDTSPSLNGGFA